MIYLYILYKCIIIYLFFTKLPLNQWNFLHNIIVPYWLLVIIIIIIIINYYFLNDFYLFIFKYKFCCKTKMPLNTLLYYYLHKL